jgi:hypothetical protein
MKVTAKQTFFEFLWHKFFNLTSIKAGNAAVPRASMSFLFLKNFGRDYKVFENFAKYYACNESLHEQITSNITQRITSY